jgi:anti-anti-sigma factor
MSLKTEILKSDDGKCRIQLDGRLDTSTAPDLEEKLMGIDLQKHSLQILDLANLEYISSAGIRVLFKAKKRASDGNAKLLFVNPKPSVKKVFDIVKALPSESIFRSMEELDTYLDNIQRNVQN